MDIVGSQRSGRVDVIVDERNEIRLGPCRFRLMFGDGEWASCELAEECLGHVRVGKTFYPTRWRDWHPRSGGDSIVDCGLGAGSLLRYIQKSKKDSRSHNAATWNDE